MTFACTDCSTCGKCYEKQATCKACGKEISLLDESCTFCEEPITDKMRERARSAYMDAKKQEHNQILELAAQAKKKRKEKEADRPEYPWD